MDKEDITKEAVDKLKDNDRVQSIILFGSVAKGEAGDNSDVDLCLVEKDRKKVELADKIKINSDLPEKVELSFFHDLPLDIRSRVFKEGQVLYTEDKYQLLKLLEETDFELPYYLRKKREYHDRAMKRARAKADKQ